MVRSQNSSRWYNSKPEDWAEHVLKQLEGVNEPYRSQFIAEVKRRLALNGKPLDGALLALALHRIPDEVHRTRLMQEVGILLNRTVAVFGRKNLEVNREA
jgi:hypothetical protein